MTSQPANRRETINLDPNVPVKVSLKYAQARRVQSRNGERAMFTTTDDRVLFVDLVVARQIEDLNPQAGELIAITKVQRNGKGPITFTVARVAGEQPNRTFVVPALPSAPETPRKPMASETLAAEASSLVDTYMQVLAHARKTHGDAVDPSAVRALVTTAYIQRAKLSSVA